jgi:hypothetical protein
MLDFEDGGTMILQHAALPFGTRDVLNNMSSQDNSQIP